jgi:hypothetical protein
MAELTPKNMQLNEVEPIGFTTAPRVLSHEVATIREQVTLLCEALGRLVDLQSELDRKVTEALLAKDASADHRAH